MNFTSLSDKSKIYTIFIATLIVVALITKSIFVPIILVFLFFLIKNPKKNRFIQFLKDLINQTNMKNYNNITEVYTDNSNLFIKIFKYGIVLIILIFILSKFIIIIGAGQTGVVSLFGKVRDEELRSGLHFVNPLNKVTKMNIQTQQYTMSVVPGESQNNTDDRISSLTKEGLNVDVDITTLYRLNENNASDIYRDVGLDYVSKLIRPEIRGVIRDVVSQYEAKELYSEKRQEASLKIFDTLSERLNNKGIIIEQAMIRNLLLPPSLLQAIQQKLSAEQESQKYDFILETERKEADRKRIEAEGQRDAQKIIKESLSDQYLNYLYIKELKDRPGTIYVPTDPSNGMPMFKGIGQ